MYTSHKDQVNFNEEDLVTLIPTYTSYEDQVNFIAED